MQHSKKIAYEHMHATQCVCAHTNNIRQAYRQQVWISETELSIHEILKSVSIGTMVPTLRKRVTIVTMVPTMRKSVSIGTMVPTHTGLPSRCAVARNDKKG